MKLRLAILYIILLFNGNAMAQSPVAWTKIYKGEYGAFIFDIQTGLDSTYFFAGCQYIFVDGSMHTQGWYMNINQQGNTLTEGAWNAEGYFTVGKTVKVQGPGNYSIIGSGGPIGNAYLMYMTVDVKEKKIKKTIYPKPRLANYYKAFESQQGNLYIVHDISTENRYFRLTRFRNKSATQMDTVGISPHLNTWINDLYEKENGNIILVGGTDTTETRFSARNLLMEVDKNMKVLWVIERDKARFDNIYLLCPVENGEYIISGCRSITIGSNRKVVWHARIDAKGNVLWERELPQFVTSYPHSQLVSYKDGLFAYAGQDVSDDVYVMLFDKNGEPVWEYTYNTTGTETVNALTVGTNGDLIVAGEYSSGSNRQAFVYCFNPQNTRKPEPPSMNIHIRDAEDKQPLPATLKVKFEDGSVKEFTADTSGINISIPKDESCIIQAEALGYLIKQDIVITPEEVKPDFYIDLDRVKAGTSIVMKNVQFERGTTTLLTESYAELDKLVQFLNAHPEVKIELSGHTDNVGVPKANQTLSEQRVATVKDYLVSRGIAANRITGKGYGGSKPIAPNDTEENKSKNRRVEVKIL